MIGRYWQIGEVSERTGLSLNTIRRYEQLGLLSSTRRSAGGFRLYDEDDLRRLQLLCDMRPLEFSVEERRALLTTLDALKRTPRGAERATLLDRLTMYRQVVAQRIDALGAQLEGAQGVAVLLAEYAHPAGRARPLSEPAEPEPGDD
jgi:MerR family copper efflux transcriptional regulator